jgi:hypothetical protein
MGYACCRTNFHTITEYSVVSCYLYTHIHHKGQQFFWESWKVQQKAKYYFFEGV